MKLETKVRTNPYLGPQPFERQDRSLFFGRDHEIKELLSLITAHRVVIVYAKSGAGKTSLINAGLIPQMEEEGFEILPVARVQGVMPASLRPHDVANLFVFHTLLSWSDRTVEPRELKDKRLADYLVDQKHRTDSWGLPAPRVVIFDQFEEIFNFYPERWQDRADLFQQITTALQGTPMELREEDLLSVDSLVAGLCDYRDPLAGFLRERLSPSLVELLYVQDNTQTAPEGLEANLVAELNQLLRNETLYDEECAARVRLSKHTKDLIEQNPQGRERIRLNRLLLEEAFPGEIRHQIDGDPFLRVMLVLREDYLAQLDPYIPLLPRSEQTRFRLECLQRDAALRAVCGPLEHTDRSFAPLADEQLVDDLLTDRVVTASGELEEIPGQYVEPVQLQIVCQKLWATLPPHVHQIEYAHVQQFGNVDAALTAFYEEGIEAAAKQKEIDEYALREWFGKTLITPMGTRSTIYRDEHAAKTGGIPNQIVDTLVDRHIIRAEKRAGIRWYELTHDRLIKPILTSNEQWFAQWRAAHRNPLTDAAQQWQRLDRDEGSLFAGRQLEEAEEWAQTHRQEMEALEQQFLDASVALRRRRAKEREEQRRRELRAAQELAAEAEARRVEQKIAAQKLRLRAVWLGVACGFALLFLFVALGFAYNSTVAAQDATIGVARLLASESQRELTANPQRSLLLAVEGVETAEESGEGYAFALVNRIDSLRGAKHGHEAEEAAVTIALHALQQALSTTTSLPLRDIHGQVISDTTSMALSPDGRWLALGCQDGSVHLWDQTGDVVDAVAVDHEIVHRGAVTASAFSPDSAWLAAGGTDGLVSLFDMAAPEQAPTPVSLGNSLVLALAFHPAEPWLAISDDAGRVLRIDLPPQGEAATLLENPDTAISTLVFSPEGDWLATVTVSDTLRIWPVHSEPPLTADASQLLSQDKNGIVAFSSDGRWLAAGSTQTPSAVLYEFDPQEMSVHETAYSLPGQARGIRAMAFSPDSSLLAVGDADGIVKMWELDLLGLAPNGQPGAERASVPARNGSQAGGAPSDGEITYTPASVEPMELPQRNEEIGALEFRQLVCEMGQEYMADLESGDITQRLQQALAERGIVFAATASIVEPPPGTGAEWCISDKERTVLIDERDGSLHITGVTWLASAGADGAVELWDMSNLLAAETKLYGHEAAVHSAALDPMHRYAFALAQDGVVRMWQMDTDLHPDNVGQLQDELAAWETTACRRAARDFTSEYERDKYFGGAETPSACGEVLAHATD